MRSPIKWFGGKGNMVKKLLPLIPEHRVYVEPFGGAASLLFAKTPSPVEIYNDVDSGLVNFFRVLRDPETFEAFRRKVICTPYSREEYLLCRATWRDCEDKIEKAYRWFVVARMSFSGDFAHSWGFVVHQSCRGMAGTCSSWLSAIDSLPEVHARLMRVQIEHQDWKDCIATYDSRDSFFYVDPPYTPDTRRSGKYTHELSMEDHQALVDTLLNIKGKAILSGYNHPVYAPLEAAGWLRQDFKTVCHAAAKTRGTGLKGKGSLLSNQQRIESIWISPNARPPEAPSLVSIT